MPNGNLGVHLSPLMAFLFHLSSSWPHAKALTAPSGVPMSVYPVRGSSCFVLKNALRQWRRGNMSQLGVDCLNLVQHLQLRCLEDRFLPQKKGKKGTAKAQSLQHLIFHLPAFQTAPDGVHRHRQTTKQLVFAVAATNWTDTDTTCPVAARAFKHRLHDSLVSSMFARKVLGDRDWLRPQ